VTQGETSFNTSRIVHELQRGIRTEENFRWLFDRYYPAIYSLLRRRGFSEEDSNDLAQETFLRVFRGIKQFRGKAQFSTWLFDIAYNVLRNELRNRSRDKRTGEEISVDATSTRNDPESESVPQLHDPRSDPHEALLKDERMHLLRQELYRLPAQMRGCVLLKVYQGLKVKEIAIILRISEGAIKAHLYQARQRLQEALADYFDDIEV
jgi:RNA polymerase sigma-70 factor (ECF subfamily)